MSELNISVLIMKENMLISGEIYIAGKNFTLPPAVTAWTNSTSVHFYCNKVWWSIAFLLQSTAMQVALDHAPMHCTAFHRQLLLHLSYNWPMEKKTRRRCFVQFPIAIFQIFGCKMWPQHARFVFWMSTNIHPSVTASVQKLAQSRLRLSFCVFVFSPTFQKNWSTTLLSQ